MHHFVKKTFLAAVSLGLATGAMAQDADYGAELYMDFCSACHGSNAEGGGTLTQLLTTEVPSLTGLKENNDGVFPMLDVIHIIDGRTGLRAHGGQVLSLAYYLESIQK